MCAHMYDVALCVKTIRKVPLGLWLVGHPWFIPQPQKRRCAKRS